MFYVTYLFLNTDNKNIMVKCHWEELFSECKFYFVPNLFYILHLYSSLFCLLMYIYLLDLWLHKVNTVKDRKFNLLSLFGFGFLFYFFVYTSYSHPLIPTTVIEPFSSNYTVLCRNYCFVIPASFLICAF